MSGVVDNADRLVVADERADVVVLPCRLATETVTPVTVDLTAGEAVTVRRVSADDRSALRAYLEGLSPDARYLRFLQAMPRVPDAVLDLFLAGQTGERVALVAVRGDEIIAEAMLAPDREGCRAEIAYSVAADVRRRGLGSAMVRMLLGIAGRRGLQSIHATMSPQNRASALMLGGLGARHRFEDGLLVSELECCAPQLIAA